MPCFSYPVVSHNYQNESAIPLLCISVWSHSNLDMDVGSSSSMQNHPIGTPPKWNFPSASEWINCGTLIQRGKRNKLLIHTQHFERMSRSVSRVVNANLQSYIFWKDKIIVTGTGWMVPGVGVREGCDIKEEQEEDFGGSWPQWWQHEHFLVLKFI